MNKFFSVDRLKEDVIQEIEFDSYSTSESRNFNGLWLSKEDFELLKKNNGYIPTSDERLNVSLVLTIIKLLRKDNVVEQDSCEQSINLSEEFRSYIRKCFESIN